MSSAKHENPLMLERALSFSLARVEGNWKEERNGKEAKSSLPECRAATTNQSAQSRLVGRHFQSLHSLLTDSGTRERR